MSLKIKLKMRKSTEEVIQKSEELTNTSKLESKFNDGIFLLRDTVLDKIQRLEDLSTETLNFMD